MNEQTNPAEETVLNEETKQKISEDGNAKQITPEESGSTSGKEKSEQVDFSQMYDMLTERDNTIKSLKEDIAELKKTNTQLLLKVNASKSPGDATKDPYESFIDLMGKR